MAIGLGINPRTQLNNCSWSGSKLRGNTKTTDNAFCACSNKRISDLSLRINSNPDIVICFISCNDWGGSRGEPILPIGTWKTSDPIPPETDMVTSLREGYAILLNKIHIMYPMARIFCCTILDDISRDTISGWPSNNENNVSTDEWNSNIIEIARAFGCEIINMHECGINYHNIRNLSVDNGLHPNAEGHTLIANKVISELIFKF